MPEVYLLMPTLFMFERLLFFKRFKKNRRKKAGQFSMYEQDTIDPGKVGNLTPCSRWSFLWVVGATSHSLIFFSYEI